MKKTLAYEVVLNLPFGRFGLNFEEDEITRMEFLPPRTSLARPKTPQAKEAVERIRAWLAEPSTVLELPLRKSGSPFQQAVWDIISTIPCGTVLTYSAIAEKLGSAPRAVGQACGANQHPLAIPCHRVVSIAGIGGFANAVEGYQLDAKRWLLKNEGVL